MQELTYAGPLDAELDEAGTTVDKLNLSTREKNAPRTAYTPGSQAWRAASSPSGRRGYGSRQEREMVVGSAKKLKLMRDMYHSS